jgi:hypothetical protein
LVNQKSNQRNSFNSKFVLIFLFFGVMIYSEIQDDSNQHRVAYIRRCLRCLHDWSPRLRRPLLAFQTGIINKNNNQHELVCIVGQFHCSQTLVSYQLGLRPFRSAHLWRVNDPRDGPGSNRGRTFSRRRILSDAIRGQRHCASLLFRFRRFHPWNCHGKLHEWRTAVRGNLTLKETFKPLRATPLIPDKPGSIRDSVIERNLIFMEVRGGWLRVASPHTPARVQKFSKM